MQKIKAKRLENVINYFANEFTNNVWEAELQHHFEKDWKVEVRLNNSAYRHELNALMMLVNSTITVSVFQEVDDNKQIVWKIW